LVAALGTTPFLIVGAMHPQAGRWGNAAIAAGVIAAVAEELFFRRFLYGSLERWGAPAAVLGSSIAFAAIHISGWGYELLPLNLAAGVLLGWQRWASGGWSAPAVSHVVANLVAMGLII
jgi:membrane protease YdiL (CAAX protease family)